MVGERYNNTITITTAATSYHIVPFRCPLSCNIRCNFRRLHIAGWPPILGLMIIPTGYHQSDCLTETWHHKMIIFTVFTQKHKVVPKIRVWLS